MKKLFNKIKHGELNESNLIENLAEFDNDILSLLIRIHPTSLFTTRHFETHLINMIHIHFLKEFFLMKKFWKKMYQIA